jgi:hypothetical protein
MRSPPWQVDTPAIRRGGHADFARAAASQPTPAPHETQHHQQHHEQHRNLEQAAVRLAESGSSPRPTAAQDRLKRWHEDFRKRSMKLL